MRKKIVAGNWKMHTNRAQAISLAQAFAGNDQADVLLIPPFPYLSAVSTQLKSGVKLGAQNVSMYANGAHTGEVSAEMLKDLGCDYVLVGHSERRQHYGEGNALVASKFARAQQAGLSPVLCVGETLSERQSEQTLTIIQAQLATVLDLVGIDAFANAVVAYEPVWAIGTGVTATPEQAQDVHAAIRGFFRSRSASIAASLQILYGGSVKASNAQELLAQLDIDGALVGGASLVENEFASIISAASIGTR
jgi:triosephosphate isomerase (TIM)